MDAHFASFQEVGGLSGIQGESWTYQEKSLQGRMMGVIACQPHACRRGSAISSPAHLVHDLRQVYVLTAGLALEFRHSGCRQFVISLHLPHAQRHDCIDVWHQTTQDVGRVLTSLRYTCEVYIGADLNLDLCAPVGQGDVERRFLLQQLALDYQLVASRPDRPTWCNTRGSSSAIDYVLARASQLQTSVDTVHELSRLLIGSDHECVSMELVLAGARHKREYRKHSRCGKWLVDLQAVQDLRPVSVFSQSH